MFCDCDSQFVRIIFLVFRPARPGDMNKVIIANNPQEHGCWSYVGKQNGVQYIQLSRGCINERTISHEVMHSIGFFHEHTRPDRDQYVQINESCVREGKFENSFKIQTTSLTYGLKYRARSIMHYTSHAFTIGNCQTIHSKVSH